MSKRLIPDSFLEYIISEARQIIPIWIVMTQDTNQDQKEESLDTAKSTPKSTKKQAPKKTTAKKETTKVSDTKANNEEIDAQSAEQKPKAKSTAKKPLKAAPKKAKSTAEEPKDVANDAPEKETLEAEKQKKSPPKKASSPKAAHSAKANAKSTSIDKKSESIAEKSTPNDTSTDDKSENLVQVPATNNTSADKKSEVISEVIAEKSLHKGTDAMPNKASSTDIKSKEEALSEIAPAKQIKSENVAQSEKSNLDASNTDQVKDAIQTSQENTDGAKEPANLDAQIGEESKSSKKNHKNKPSHRSQKSPANKGSQAPDSTLKGVDNSPASIPSAESETIDEPNQAQADASSDGNKKPEGKNRQAQKNNRNNKQQNNKKHDNAPRQAIQGQQVANPFALWGASDDEKLDSDLALGKLDMHHQNISRQEDSDIVLPQQTPANTNQKYSSKNNSAKFNLKNNGIKDQKQIASDKDELADDVQAQALVAEQPSEIAPAHGKAHASNNPNAKPVAENKHQNQPNKSSSKHHKNANNKTSAIDVADSTDKVANSDKTADSADKVALSNTAKGISKASSVADASSTPDEAVVESSPELSVAPATPRLSISDANVENHPERALPELSFENLSEALKEAALRANWPSLMPVQSKAMPYLLAKRDIMVQSKTGSGKTGAFLLPTVARLDPEIKSCQALILVPTRELALQVEEDAKLLYKDTNLQAVAVYGGVGYTKQQEAIQAGAQLVIGTPGRLLDHLLKRNLSLSQLRMLILDEADRMLSIGFYPDMKDVQRYVPKNGVATHFFSATFPPQVLRVAGEFMDDPLMLTLSSGQVHVDHMDHVFYPVSGMDKDRTLIRLIEIENPTSAIIFCNTRSNVHYVTAVLKGFGYNADELSSDSSQSQREAVLNKLRSGELRFLVATDVAARGIDIPDLSHVILFEPPEDHESYIHRAGRTGRAGAGGTVISLVDIMEKIELQNIAKHYKIDLIEKQTPDDVSVSEIISERLVSLLEGKLRECTRLKQERMKRFLPIVQRLANDEEISTLLCMLFDEKYHESLHANMSIPLTLPESKVPHKKHNFNKNKKSFPKFRKNKN